jgi:hypothetical protein
MICGAGGKPMPPHSDSARLPPSNPAPRTPTPRFTRKWRPRLLPPSLLLLLPQQLLLQALVSAEAQPLTCRLCLAQVWLNAMRRMRCAGKIAD